MNSRAVMYTCWKLPQAMRAAARSITFRNPTAIWPLYWRRPEETIGEKVWPGFLFMAWSNSKKTRGVASASFFSLFIDHWKKRTALLLYSKNFPNKAFYQENSLKLIYSIDFVSFWNHEGWSSSIVRNPSVFVAIWYWSSYTISPGEFVYTR